MSYKKSTSLKKASIPVGIVALGNIINHFLALNNVAIEPQDVLSVLMLAYGGYIGIVNWIKHRPSKVQTGLRPVSTGTQCVKNPANPQ